ncbi:c-type cytochrome [bacterium]|nr:c-type cytochrome [bacterium]
MFERFCILCLFLFLVGSAWTEEGTPKQDAIAEQLPRILAREPADAGLSFALLHGFQMQLVASEPHVVDPVDAAFDEEGRLWVVEMRGYPYPEEGPKIGRVRLLTDTDDDGVFDQSVIVAEGLPWPTGIALFDQGCFVIAAPDLWYFKDTTGDGVADVQEKVWTGFEKANVQALANNLKWGLDGRIYGASAGNGGLLTRVDDPASAPVSVHGRDFAFDPKTRQLQAISGTMQFGQSFNDWYDRFVCGNSNHAMHVVLDDRYLQRNKHLSSPRLLVDIAQDGGAGPVFRQSRPEPWRVVRTARRAASGQSFSTAELNAAGYFTSASGVTIYRGDAYPAPYQGNLFVGDVGGNLIHRKSLEQAGATFLAKRADEGVEWVTSTDNWFRPVNFVNGPDGCLYVLDMYRETIEHPWSIPEDIKAHVDLESGKDRGRIYRLAPPGYTRRPTEKLGELSTTKLIRRLSSSNGWHRETAQRLLIERRDAETPAALHRLLQDLAELKIPHEDVYPAALAQLHAMAILEVLGDLRDGEIAQGISHPQPRLREQAIRWAEDRLSKNDQLADLVIARAGDEAFRVRWQVALSLGELPAEKRISALTELAMRDGQDLWMRTAIICSAHDRPDLLLDSLWKQPTAAPTDLVAGLVRLIGAARSPEGLASLLTTLSGRPAATQREVLATLGTLWGSADASILLQEPARISKAETWLAELIATSRKLVLDPSADLMVRVQGIGVLAFDPSPDIRHWADLLAASQPKEVQLAGLELLARSKSDQVGPLVVDAWSATSPGIRGELIEVLLARPDRQAALVEGIEKGAITASQITSSARARLLGASDRSLAARMEKILSALSGSRQETLNKYRPALSATPADLSIGQKVFTRECATCHKVQGAGYEVGPNLATIVGRSPEQLLQNILDPSSEVQPSFIEVSIVLDDGRVASGMVASENANSVTLKRAEGVTQTISRDSIESMQSTGKSLMPEGIEQKISPTEMAHLIAYLLDATDTSKITGKPRR